MLVNKNKKTKLLFHVNYVKNSFIVLSSSMATFVMWLKKEQSILRVRVLSSSEASFRLSQHNTGSLSHVRIKSFLESEYGDLFMPRQRLAQKPIRKYDDPLSRSAWPSFSLLHRNLAEIAVFKCKQKPSLQELYPVAYR